MKLVSDRLLKKVVINRLPDSHKSDMVPALGRTYPYGGAVIMTLKNLSQNVVDTTELTPRELQKDHL